jgi:D-ribose pyranase
MLEVGMINMYISGALAYLGHMDEMIIADAGFPLPLGVNVIDISLSENKPTVTEVYDVIIKYFSIEKLVFANETKHMSPSHYKRIINMSGNVEVETIPHTELKKRAKHVKLIIRTGDFTAFSNVLIVSGAGNRWYIERNK